MKLFSHYSFFIYLLVVYIVYSTITGISIYFIGVYPKVIFCLFVCVMGFALRPRITKIKTEAVAFLFGWSLVFMLSTVINYARPGLVLLNSFLFCLFFLCINIKVQIEIFEKYAWLLCFLFFISAIEYVVYSFTSKGLIIADVTREQNMGYQNFSHLIFNIIRNDTFNPRFQGLFIEPGNMGTTCAFMLFATWKKRSMRFPFFVFLLCGMLSMSLAFYVFLLMFLMTNIRLSVKTLVVSTVIVMIFLNSFGDVFESKILDRINDAENIEELDNRTSELMERAFWKAIEDGQIITGVGIDNIPGVLSSEGGSAGAKKWIYQYGVISLVIIFWIYNLVYYRRCDNKLKYSDWVFLFVFWSCFYKSVPFLVPPLFVVYSIMPELNKMDKTSV